MSDAVRKRGTLMLLLWENGIRQGEFADGIGLSRAFVHSFLHGRYGASEETLVVMKRWLEERLGRAVSLEEILSVPEEPSAGTSDSGAA